MYSKINISNSKFRIPNSKKHLVELCFGICFFFFGISAQAQCAMCRAAIESEGNDQKAVAINDGIVYLMAMPYLLVAAVGYYIYRMNRKNKA